MQYRAIDKDENLEIQTDFPISTVVDVRIVFCPWCGRSVEKFYAADVDSLYRVGLKIDGGESRFAKS